MHKAELTQNQKINLEIFLRMTTRYRKDEIDACEKLSKKLDEDGKLRYPKMPSNAQWWKECDETINEILNIIDDL